MTSHFVLPDLNKVHEKKEINKEALKILFPYIFEEI